MKIFISLISFLFTSQILLAQTNSNVSCEKELSEKCLITAKECYKNGNFDEAKKYYTALCDLNDMTGCAGLGATEYKLGKKDAAIRVLNKACEGLNIKACEIVKIINPEDNSIKTENPAPLKQQQIVSEVKPETIKAVIDICNEKISRVKKDHLSDRTCTCIFHSLLDDPKKIIELRSEDGWKKLYKMIKEEKADEAASAEFKKIATDYLSLTSLTNVKSCLDGN